MPISISSNHTTAGAMSSSIRHACANAPSAGRAAGEDFDHVDAIERQPKHDAIALTDRLLPHPETPMISTPFGTISALDGVAHREQLAALEQPLLQDRRDRRRGPISVPSAMYSIDARSVHQERFSSSRSGTERRAERLAAGGGATNRVPRLIQRQALQRARQLRATVAVVGLGRAAGGGDALAPRGGETPRARPRSGTLSST